MADPVLSSRRTAEDPARSLSGFSRNQQEFILHRAGVLVRTNSELGSQFTAHVVEADAGNLAGLDTSDRLSFCVTIDSEARDYLPHMYGAIHYVLIDEVRKLPLKVSDIYRKLTAQHIEVFRFR
jgi:hypothetical protein